MAILAGSVPVHAQEAPVESVMVPRHAHPPGGQLAELMTPRDADGHTYKCMARLHPHAHWWMIDGDTNTWFDRGEGDDRPAYQTWGVAGVTVAGPNAETKVAMRHGNWVDRKDLDLIGDCANMDVQFMPRP